MANTSSKSVAELPANAPPIQISLTINQLCALVASDDEVTTEHWQVEEVILALDRLGLLVRSDA